jgi:GNAT superfamily N-acetyltransferase
VEVAQAPDAEALVEAADQHYAALAFRAIDVRDAAVGAALAPPLLARGYRAHPDLLMLLHATPPAPDPAIAIAEVERAALASSRAAASQVGSQLVSRDALIAVAVDQRCFAVLDGAEVVARCVLYAADGVAQVENVYTAPSHRGRGLARALVVAAARAAGPAGPPPHGRCRGRLPRDPRRRHAAPALSPARLRRCRIAATLPARRLRSAVACALGRPRTRGCRYVAAPPATPGGALCNTLVTLVSSPAQA